MESPIDFEKGAGMMENEPAPDAGKGVELRFDPVTVPGLKDHQPGDKVKLTIEGTLGDPGEDGVSPVMVDRIDGEAMNVAKKATRDMMGRKPSMEGTNVGKSEDEGY